MPVSHTFDGRIIALCLEGVYTTQDLKDGILRALDDPACPSEPVLLFDQRHSESLDQRSTADVRHMADFLASLRARFSGRLAMVVSGDIGYGMMRIGSVHAEHGGVEPNVFRDMDDARVWLLA